MSKAEQSEATVVSRQPRRLRPDERALIGALLREMPQRQSFTEGLDSALVSDMNDGGMGSLRFVAEDGEVGLGEQVAAGDFLDEDGIAVSVVLNLDGAGRLFELDFWKVDFSPLRRYPQPSEVRLRPWGGGGRSTRQAKLGA